MSLLLKEDGGRLLREGSGALLLEAPITSPPPPVPEPGDWDTQITQSHGLSIRLVLLDDGVEVDELEAIDGSVTLDATAATRGRADLAFVDDGTLGLVPQTPTSPLAPYGNEIRVERGIVYTNGAIERVPLGVFRIDDVDVTDSADGLQIRVGAPDRSARIIDARFEDPYQIAAGTNYAGAILDTILAAWPDCPNDFTATSTTTPQLVANEGDDRWAFCQDMATSIGMELYFDGNGVLVLVPTAQAGSGPVAALLVEGEGGVLVAGGLNWTRQGTFNRVIATGENTGEAAPARAVATDVNPESPTYYYGPFGKVPRFYSSPFIATDAQAQDAAEAILAKELGTTQKVNFGSVVNPRLKPGDVVRITRARAGIDEDHVIDQLTIPLSATDQMTGTTRAQQVS